VREHQHAHGGEADGEGEHEAQHDDHGLLIGTIPAPL
jgi:hypothetical protein